MNTKVETFPMDEIPLPNTYGAAELKGFIRRYTYRGLMVTVGLLILLMVFYFVFNKIQASQNDKAFEAPITKIDLENLPQEESEIIDIAPQVQTLNTGPAARAGNPVPVPDAQVSPDMKDFATMDVMSRASAEGGDGIDIGGFAAGVTFEDKPVEVKHKEEEIVDPNTFVAVEKEPNVDLGKLQGLVQYPDVARRAGIEGTVILRVYVDKNGQAKRVLVEHSDNQMLDKGAIDAISKYGYIPPAIQNGQNIGCWVSIPIKFKLR